MSTKLIKFNDHFEVWKIHNGDFDTIVEYYANINDQEPSSVLVILRSEDIVATPDPDEYYDDWDYWDDPDAYYDDWDYVPNRNNDDWDDDDDVYYDYDNVWNEF